jgi:hypothetical protein
VAQDFGELIVKDSWLNQLGDVILGHGISLLRWRSGGVKHPHDMPPSRFPPSPTSGDSSPKLQANAPIMFQGASDIVSNSMKLFREQEVLLGCFSVLLLLSGCGGAEPECDSLDTRNSVVKIVSDDSNNALVNYAVKNSDAVAAKVSNTNTEADKSAILEKARQGAVYTLDDTIRVNSRNRATRAVTCSGLLYVTVAETTAQKEVEFKVEQTADGKMFVSVSPFQF